MKYRFKNLSLSTRIQIKIISVSVFIITILIIINAYKTRSTSLSQVKELIESRAREYANINKTEFENVTNKFKLIAFSFQYYEKINASERREFFNQSLKNLLEKNSEYIGIGLIWEPGLLDGLDSNYINEPGCSKTGRYIPYFTRRTTGIDVQQSENFESAYWYSVSKNSLKLYITEPSINTINNKDLLVSTISLPIISDGNIKAILYANVSFEKLTLINNQLRVLNSGYGQLINCEGNILSHPVKKYINKPIENFKEKKSEIIDALNKNKCFSVIENNTKSNSKVFKVYAPAKVEDLLNPLSFVIIVPYYEIANTTKTNIYQSILIGIIGLILLIIAAYFISKNLVKPIKKATQAINTIAITGRIDYSKKITITTKDNFGELGHAINDLIDELNTKTNFANEIKLGHLDSIYNPLSKEDILGNSLLEMKQSLIKTAEEEKIRKFEDDKRNWTAEGLAKFAEILRKNNDNIEILTYELIKNLVKYLKANQGGIFLINEENINDTFLELISCFAYDRQKYLNKKILIGEGLVGSCYLEKKSIYLTNIPKSYINISSGLGDSNPSCVLLVPIILNESNFGVIEMASFEKIETYQIEFIEKVAEIIASTISSVKINMKTAYLLSQSQEQAEAMKAQEEEMRQNMEELTATQESLAEKDLYKQREIDQLKAIVEEKNLQIKQKEEESIYTIASINEELQKCLQNSLLKNERTANNSFYPYAESIFKSIANVILDLDMTVISFNDMFLSLINKNESEVKGYKLNIVLNIIQDHIELSSNVHTSLKKGQVYIENILFSDPSHLDKWLQVVFYPFTDQNNNLENIIACFYEVTKDIQLQNSLLETQADLISQIELLKQQNSDSINSKIENNIITSNSKLTTLLKKAFIFEEYLIDGQILFVNNLFEELYGFHKGEIEGTNIISLIPDKLKKEFRMIWDSLIRGNIFKGETCRLSKPGNEIWLSSVYLPIFDETKNIQKIIFLAFDISESKKLEIENQKQIEIIKKYEGDLKKTKASIENSKKSTFKKKPQ